MGIGPGRTIVRRGTVAGLFGHPACRICPQVVFANQSSRPLVPRPGAGDYLRLAGKKKPAGRGSGDNGNRRMCLLLSLRSSSLRLVSLPYSRRYIPPSPRSCSSVVRFAVVPYRLRPCAFALSSRYLRLVMPSPSSSRHRLVACLLIPSRLGGVSFVVSFVLLVARLVVLFLIACLVSSLCISSPLPHAIVFTPVPTVFGIASHIVRPSTSLCVPYEKPTPTSW